MPYNYKYDDRLACDVTYLLNVVNLIKINLQLIRSMLNAEQSGERERDDSCVGLAKRFHYYYYFSFMTQVFFVFCFS